MNTSCKNYWLHTDMIFYYIQIYILYLQSEIEPFFYVLIFGSNQGSVFLWVFFSAILFSILGHSQRVPNPWPSILIYFSLSQGFIFSLCPIRRNSCFSPMGLVHVTHSAVKTLTRVQAHRGHTGAILSLIKASLSSLVNSWKHRPNIFGSIRSIWSKVKHISFEAKTNY